MKNETGILDANDAAEYLRLNVQTVRRLAREKAIPAFRVGGTWRFRRASLDRWAEAQHTTDTTKKHVLVIDDEDHVLRFVEQALSTQNRTVALASSGEQALELLDRQPPDLVILDLVMPGMDGPTVLGHVRERLGPVPVIILTAYPDSELMQRAMEHGPVMLVAKPPTLHLLLDTVEAALKAT